MTKCTIHGTYYHIHIEEGILNIELMKLGSHFDHRVGSNCGMLGGKLIISKSFQNNTITTQMYPPTRLDI